MTTSSYLQTIFYTLELSRLHGMLPKLLRRNLVHGIINVCPKIYITRLYKVILIETPLLLEYLPRS